MLTTGLESWTSAGYEVEPLRLERLDAVAWKDWQPTVEIEALGEPLTTDSAFLPRVAGQTFLEGRELPLKRDMVALFVDMVGSTRLVLERSAEEVLEIIQTFMEVVIDVGAYHCGDVHDFEGDGALLYFEGPGEAVPAAFRMRDELAQRREQVPELPRPRFSLDAGPIVVGLVGTRFRQTVALVGPAVHIAARILKLAPPGGIAATESIVVRARRENPELARRFSELSTLPAALREELGALRVWIAEPPGT